jgi:MFS family permease
MATDVTAKAVDATPQTRRTALRFIVLIGILSFFADFTYEGSRSIIGPYLATLQATGTVVGVVTGFGEFLGYGLRLFSGRWADATGRYWPITIFGYVVQMASVPALALTGSWSAAAVLIILERVGKAIRNPPRDVMLSHAGKQAGGYGWAFGLHEALDQFGAMFGPLVVSAVLAHQESYREAFAVLLVPAVINLSLVLLARVLYPRPQDMETSPPNISGSHLPRVFSVYLLGATLVAAGFADYPLIAFHFSRMGTVPIDWIAIFYAIAMAVSGTGSLILGKLFDRFGFMVLVALTLVSALFAPSRQIFLSPGPWANPSFPQRSRQWCPRRAVPRRSVSSPPVTARSGLLEVPRSASSTTFRCQRSSPFACSPRLPLCRSLHGSVNG